ncbi:MAG: chemotaxis protein CheW [Curvibacter sp.]|nr:chemotaxis protein CheW [Curvibacter sp.]
MEPQAAPTQPGAPEAAVSPVARQVLAFGLGRERYGIDTASVLEIRGFEVPDAAAGLPPVFYGVLRLRGQAVPVLDLRQAFGHPVRFDESTVLVVAQGLGQPLGLVTDGRLLVLDNPLPDLPRMDGKAQAAYVRGLGPVDAQGRWLIRLDPDVLLRHFSDQQALPV